MSTQNNGDDNEKSPSTNTTADNKTESKQNPPKTSARHKRRPRRASGWFSKVPAAVQRRVKGRMNIALTVGLLICFGALGWQQNTIEQLSQEQSEIWDSQKVMAEALSAQLEATQASLEAEKQGSTCQASANRI